MTASQEQCFATAIEGALVFTAIYLFVWSLWVDHKKRSDIRILIAAYLKAYGELTGKQIRDSLIESGYRNLSASYVYSILSDLEDEGTIILREAYLDITDADGRRLSRAKVNYYKSADVRLQGNR